MRCFSLCLAFFLSFSFFSFRKVEVVKANPLVEIFENEFAPIVVNILSSFGVVVSLPTAKDFLNQEKEYQYNLQMEFQKKMEKKIEVRKALAEMGIQAVKDGYYVSKQFCTDILDKWNTYAIKASLNSTTTPYTVTVTFPSCQQFYKKSMFAVTIEEMNSYYSKCFSSCVAYIPISYPRFKVTLCRGELRDFYATVNKRDMPDCFGRCTDFTYSMQNLYLNGHLIIDCVQSDTTGIIVDLDDDYKVKPKPNQKVIDNVLNPVDSKNQGIVISPKNIESVDKVFDPSIPDVPSSSITNNVPINQVASAYPEVATGSDVGALPWDIGSTSIPSDTPIDKPIDKPVDKPVDKPIDKPVDNPVDKPVDKPLDKPTDKIDFTPFTAVSENIKEVFPFCIPWDIANGFKTLVAPEKAPVFDIKFDKQYFNGGGSLHIDLTQFESVAKIFRFFIMLTFSICIVILTRNVIGGN